MAIIPLDSTFDGFASDVSRDQLKAGLAYRMLDFIPQNDAPLRGRGGWDYASQQLNGGSYISGGGWFRKSADALAEYVVVVTDEGVVLKLEDMNEDDDGVKIGTLKKVDKPLDHNPLYYDSRLVFVKPDGGLVTWDGKKLKETLANYRVAAPWGDFLIVANKKNEVNKVWWCINTTSIFNSDSFAEVPAEVAAIAGFPRQIIVFGYQDVWSFYGDNPPPGGNLSMHTLFHGKGIMDQRTMAVTDQQVVWAHSTGIYRTDGSNLEDLTASGGIQVFWHNLLRDFKLQDGWIATASVLYHYYFITITPPDDYFPTDPDVELTENQKLLFPDKKVTLVCNLENSKWFQLTNIDAACYIHRPGGNNSTEELFFGSRKTPRINSLSQLWLPSASNAFDGDGTPVLPELETRFYRLSDDQLKRIRRLLMRYQLATTQGLTSISVGSITTPEQVDYEPATSEFPIQQSTERDRVDIRDQARGIAFKLKQTEVSDDTRIFSLELEGHELSESR